MLSAAVVIGALRVNALITNYIKIMPLQFKYKYTLSISFATSIWNLRGMGTSLCLSVILQWEEKL